MSASDKLKQVYMKHNETIKDRIITIKDHRKLNPIHSKLGKIQKSFWSQDTKMYNFTKKLIKFTLTNKNVKNPN